MPKEKFDRLRYPRDGILEPVGSGHFDTMHRYLATVDRPQVSDIGFVFGSSCAAVATKAAELYWNGLVGKLVVVGGVGKDSGALVDYDLAEAFYLHMILEDLDVPRDDIVLESSSHDGRSNVLNGLEVIQRAGLGLDSATLVARGPQMRRLHHQFDSIVGAEGLQVTTAAAAAEYRFRSCCLHDQVEVAREILLLRDGNPAGGYGPYLDVNARMVDWAELAWPHLQAAIHAAA